MLLNLLADENQDECVIVRTMANVAMQCKLSAMWTMHNMNMQCHLFPDLCIHCPGVCTALHCTACTVYM